MTTFPQADRFQISHSDGSITALNDAGHVAGWTEVGALGWSAFWRSRAGDQRRFADSAAHAAQVLRAALAEETR